MTLTDLNRRHLAIAAKNMPAMFAEGGQELADDLRETLPDLTDVQICRVVLQVSEAVMELIRALHVEPVVNATLVVGFLDGTALELARIEMGIEP